MPVKNPIIYDSLNDTRRVAISRYAYLDAYDLKWTELKRCVNKGIITDKMNNDDYSTWRDACLKKIHALFSRRISEAHESHEWIKRCE